MFDVLDMLVDDFMTEIDDVIAWADSECLKNYNEED